MLCCAALLFSGCAEKAAAPKEEAPAEAAKPIEKVSERGPIAVTLRADKDSISIAENLTLTIEVVIDEGYEVAMPKFGEKLEGFGIVDYQIKQPSLLDGGKITQAREYILEPFLSGEYTIPPMEIGFSEQKAAEQESAEPAHTIETEAVTITVTSLLPEDMENLQLAPLAAPLDMPAPDRSRVYGAIAGGLLALLMIAALIVWWRRRKKVEAGPPPAPPREAALTALEALVAEDLIEQGAFKEFYIRISDILRRYLEGEFGLHAPERTTEEFLIELQGSQTLSKKHHRLLREFLEHCDLVKFATHHPTTPEIQRTFDTCKQFVLEESAPGGAVATEGF